MSIVQIIVPASWVAVPQSASAAIPSLVVQLIAGAVVCAIVGAAGLAFLRVRAMRRISEQSVLSDHVFTAFFGDANVGIAVLDEHGAILRSNSVFESMLGYSESDLVGMLYFDLVDHPDEGDVRERIVGALDRFGESRHLVLRRADGSLIRARFVVTPAPATLSRKNSVIFVEEVGAEYPTQPPDGDRESRTRDAREASGRPRSQAEGVSSGPRGDASMNVVGWNGLLGTLHDEIKTPLTVILGNASLLKTEVDADNAELVDAIETSSQRLLDTLDGILYLARLQYDDIRPVVEPFDLRSVVLEAVDSERRMATDKGLAVGVAVPSFPVILEGERDAALRIVTQLVQNAVKFTETGEVSVTLTASANQIEISVADTGDGVDDAVLPRLFDPFFQASSGSRRKYRGVGLGLTAVRQLVDRLGGSIRAEARSDGGTQFLVTLPSTGSVERAA